MDSCTALHLASQVPVKLAVGCQRCHGLQDILAFAFAVGVGVTNSSPRSHPRDSSTALSSIFQLVATRASLFE